MLLRPLSALIGATAQLPLPVRPENTFCSHWFAAGRRGTGKEAGTWQSRPTQRRYLGGQQACLSKMAKPQAPLSRSQSFREQMQAEGVDVQELYDVDTVAEEDAEMLVFDATQNVWSTTRTKVKVARRMFAHGDSYGCIRLRDLVDGRTKVLKKSLAGQSDEEVYDEVKSHALAELCCGLLRQMEPALPVGFMPRVIYKLVQRSNRPKIMCEELLTDDDDFVKRPLSMFPPANASRAEEVESHTWAAFQYFTYMQSQRGMVFESCDSVNGVWMNPVIHSNDQTLGGRLDGGADAVEVLARPTSLLVLVVACG